MAWPILNLGKVDKKQRNEKGLICKMATLQFLKGPNAKMDLTMLISSSSYPKIIYGMPLIEIGVKIHFKFEFKFKLELNRKEKQKEKEKKRLKPHGLASGEQAHLPSRQPRWTEPTRQRRKQKKKNRGRAHSGPGPRPLHLHGPGG